MTNAFLDLSNALTAMTVTAGSSIVRVEGRRRLPASGIIWSADGLIITANHVVTRDDNIRVGLPEGQTVPATLVGRDPSTDTAVLRVAAANLTPLEEANKQEIVVGGLVLALGRPGQNVQATLGVVSALGGSWRTSMGGQLDCYLQTDVLMYPGFSGGALVEGNGRLLGLNSSALMGGVSLAIPTATLHRVVETLTVHGRMRRGYLGVSTQQVKLPQALREELGQKTGLLIVSSETDSPAGQAGLGLGDTIVRLDGEEVRDHEDLLTLLSSDRVGRATPIQVIRGGQIVEVSVTIGERE